MTFEESRELGDHSERPLISRFTIMFTASLLLALGMGRSIPDEVADLISLVGLTGMACYVSLELAAYYRRRNRAEVLQHAAEGRLSLRMLRMKSRTGGQDLRVDPQEVHAPDGRHTGVHEPQDAVHAA